MSATVETSKQSNPKRDRPGNNCGNNKTEEPEEPEGENSDSASDINDSGSGVGPKMKKRSREGGALKEQEHMNDSLSAPPKESSEEGKDDSGGRTCVSCRKSKVKCSKGSPCKRCSRLKLVCIAQVRGRGRPIASGISTTGPKKTAKSDGKAGGVGSTAGVGRDSGSSHPSSNSNSNSNSGSGRGFLARSGVLSPTQPALRAGSEGATTVGGGGVGSIGASGVDARSSFGFSSPTTGIPPPIPATITGCSPSLGFNGPVRGLSAADDGGGLIVGGLGGVGYGYQDFDPSSRPFPPHLLSAGRPLPSAAAQHQQQGAHGSFSAARTYTHPLLHGGGASDGAPARMASAVGRALPTTSTAMRGSISSGGSWRAVFHGEDIGPGPGNGTGNGNGTGTGPRAKGSSSLSSDGGFGGFGAKDLSWAETVDEHKDAVAAAAAAAGGEEFLSKSTDEKSRWLMDVEQYAGASGADSEDRSPEANGGVVDPTDTIVTGFWKLFSEQEVHRPKAVLVIRHWALCALERRSTHLMRKTVDMARALCINVAEILNDYGIYAMFHELLREAEAGNTIEPARPVNLGPQEAPPYIQELLTQFAAVSTRVVLRGQSTFFHNEMCTRLFMSTERANEMYSSNRQDVWATLIHPDDHKSFFDSLSIELFRAPGHKSEFIKICKCREHTGEVLFALVHFRYEFQDEGNYAAFGLSMLPLPESDYLQKVERPPALENGHEGAGAAAAGVACSGGSPIVQQQQQQQQQQPSVSSEPRSGSIKFSCGVGAGAGAGAGAAAPMAMAPKLCDASAPFPGSSASSSVTSAASSLSAVGAAASAGVGGGVGGGGGARRSSGDLGGGGGCGGDFQPLPPLGVMHQRVTSLPSQVRADPWGSHDTAGALSAAGDAGRGLDDSLDSSRGTVTGGGGGGGSGSGGGGSGGGGQGFQEGFAGGGLEWDSGRGGGLSSGWVRASGRAEMRTADGL